MNVRHLSTMKTMEKSFVWEVKDKAEEKLPTTGIKLNNLVTFQTSTFQYDNQGIYCVKNKK